MKTSLHRDTLIAGLGSSASSDRVSDFFMFRSLLHIDWTCDIASVRIEERQALASGEDIEVNRTGLTFPKEHR